MLPAHQDRHTAAAESKNPIGLASTEGFGLGKIMRVALDGLWKGWERLFSPPKNTLFQSQNIPLLRQQRSVEQSANFPAAFNLTALDGTDGFKTQGLAPGGALGYSVHTAGDFNGDGKADLVLGAAFTNEVYVLFGQNSGWGPSFNLATLDGLNGFSISGLARGRLGQSVSTAGDINSDGTDDIVLGESYSSPNGQTGAGTVYVLFGQTGGWGSSFNLTTLNGVNGFKIEGISISDNLGYSVSAAGDFNGDGKADIILGARQASPGGRTWAGSAYVIFGKANGWGASFNLTTLNGVNGFKIEGVSASDYLGHSVSTAGDLNGDGNDDLVLGAYNATSSGFKGAGTAYVIFGKAGNWTGSFSLSSLNGINGFTIGGLAIDDHLGYSVSTAGDLNGDSKAELILGAFWADPGARSQAGVAYVIFGQANGWTASYNLASLNGANGFRIEGLKTVDSLGCSVSTAGDLNGDNKADLVIGACEAYPFGRTSAGAAYVIFGKATAWGSNFNLASLNGANGFKIEGPTAYGWLGASVSTAGDFNGDGVDDLVLGAYENNSGSSNATGTVYVVFGINTSRITPSIFPPSFAPSSVSTPLTLPQPSTSFPPSGALSAISPSTSTLLSTPSHVPSSLAFTPNAALPSSSSILEGPDSTDTQTLAIAISVPGLVLLGGLITVIIVLKKKKKGCFSEGSRMKDDSVQSVRLKAFS